MFIYYFYSFPEALVCCVGIVGFHAGARDLYICLEETWSHACSLPHPQPLAILQLVYSCLANKIPKSFIFQGDRAQWRPMTKVQGAVQRSTFLDGEGAQ